MISAAPKGYLWHVWLAEPVTYAAMLANQLVSGASKMQEFATMRALAEAGLIERP